MTSDAAWSSRNNDQSPDGLGCEFRDGDALFVCLGTPLSGIAINAGKYRGCGSQFEMPRAEV